MSPRPPSTSRRRFLLGLGAGTAWAASAGHASLHAQGRGRGRGDGQPQLPLRTTGLEHLGLTVPDVAKSGEFYGRIFNPALHTEMDPPLRYYVTLGVGYLALGSVVIGTDGGDAPPAPAGAYVDHFCALAEGYSPQALRTELQSAGVEPGGGLGMIADPDGVRLQLLGIPGGMARTTIPADRISPDPPLVLPLGLDHVMLRASDVARTRDHYRLFFGAESSVSTDDQVWFRVAGTWLGITPASAGEMPRVNHFCVNVRAFDHDRVTAGLRDLGAEILPADDELIRTRYREQERIRFRDPDGLTVELKGRVA